MNLESTEMARATSMTDEDAAIEAQRELAQLIIERTAAISRWGSGVPYEQVMDRIREHIHEIIRYTPDPGQPKRSYILKSVRTQVFERDGYKCVHCGSQKHLALDHIHPWSLGGDDTPDNLQTLCKPCNSRKGARL